LVLRQASQEPQRLQYCADRHPTAGTCRHLRYRRVPRLLRAARGRSARTGRSRIHFGPTHLVRPPPHHPQQFGSR
jgi:hypothetical protein